MIRQINSLVVISLMGTSIYLRSHAYRNLSQNFCEMNASSAFIIELRPFHEIFCKSVKKITFFAFVKLKLHITFSFLIVFYSYREL